MRLDPKRSSERSSESWRCLRGTYLCTHPMSLVAQVHHLAAETRAE